MERLVLADRYELGPVIGSGGFGTVFRARDRRTGADIALKLVLPGLGSEAAAQRLRREAVILKRVDSRHVARVLDAGDDEQGVWLATELVDGAPLTMTTLGRALLPHEVLRVARGLLEGLAAVHAAGVIHGDIKPSNVLVPYGDRALDGPKIVDFGLARIVSRSEVAASIGEAMTKQGLVIGSARYMAPEVLSGNEPTVRSDIYAAGLLLFELLDEGPLFPIGDSRAQLRARVANEPFLRERIAPPLSDVMLRMLARDPQARYETAQAAHQAVADLDTAPVARIAESMPPSARRSMPPVPSSRTSKPPESHHPFSRRLPDSARPPIARLTSLPADPVGALRETLRHLDLPMLDALARRERGNPIGRIARAVALALRLELDAAALILEPLGPQSDVARAIGASLLAPRARRVTRARVDADREDKWVDSIDADLAAMLVSVAAAIATSEDASRDAARCARALVRIERLPGLEAMRTTLVIAHTAVRVRLGEMDRVAALDLIAPLEPRVEAFHVVVRALAIATIADSAGAGVELERAERIAAETGTTLLDAASATSLGRLLSMGGGRDERGLRALERASTLLAHGDAPSLEHEAEHHRAKALLAIGRWADAALHLRAAREAAHAERAGELELGSTTLSALVELAVGDTGAAYESAATLTDARLAAAGPGVAALGWATRAVVALSGADSDNAEDALRQAQARLSDRGRAHTEVFVLVEMLVIMLDALRGTLAEVTNAVANLERRAEEQGFNAFYWTGLLGAIVARMGDPIAARAMSEVLSRLDIVLGFEGRVARDRPSSMERRSSLKPVRIG